MENQVNSDKHLFLMRHSLDLSIRDIQIAASNSNGNIQLPSGFKKLDAFLHGFHKGNLIVVGGRVSMGKTAFALSVAKNICTMKKPVLYFTLLESRSDLTIKMMANKLNVCINLLRNGQLTDDDWNKIDKNITKLQEDFPLYIYDKAFLNIEEIKKVTLDAVKTKNCEMVIIDSLQMIENHNSHINNRYEEMTDTVIQLKNLAKAANVPVMVTSSINRATDESTDDYYKYIPKIEQLRDSGAIEDKANVILFIHRPEYYHIYSDKDGNDLRGLAQIFIAKNDMGPQNQFLLHFDGKYARFDNPDNMRKIEEEGEFLPSKLNDYIDSNP